MRLIPLPRGGDSKTTPGFYMADVHVYMERRIWSGDFQSPNSNILNCKPLYMGD